MKDIIIVLLSIPKTIYFNLRYFGIIKGIRLPILISYNTYLMSIKGNISIEKPLKFAMIRVGFGGIGLFDKKNRAIWHVSGNVIFKGNARIGYGTKISVTGGNLIIGDNFRVTTNSQICCNKSIIIGNDVLLSWDNLIMDTDYHNIRDFDGNIINPDKEIKIGDNVWIGCRCTILKGTNIPNNIVVSANSTLYGSLKVNEYTIIGGNPIKVLKENVIWEA